MQKPQVISITEVARHFSEWINRVAYLGESFLLLRGKKPVAELRPVMNGKKLSELSMILRTLPRLTKEEAADFYEDLKSSRNKRSKEKLQNPWAS